jgi:tetratricopeptide (TPR) repeat protein
MSLSFQILIISVAVQLRRSRPDGWFRTKNDGEEPEMMVHVSLFGLIFLISVTSYAQSRRLPGDTQTSASEDPFDRPLNQLSNPDTNWPDTDGSRHRNGHGSAATVSLQQLQHKVPKQALKEFKKARTVSSKGDNETALDHLQNAVQLDPEFADAHNDLGVALARLGNTGEAVEQFQKAVSLAPDHNRAVRNLSLALYTLQRYHEVLPVARRALKIEPGLVYVQYVLGVSLIAEHGERKEALENLERAAPKFPEARVMASDLLAKIGRREDAAWQLEEYLRSAPKGETSRQEIETRLAHLRQ